MEINGTIFQILRRDRYVITLYHSLNTLIFFIWGLTAEKASNHHRNVSTMIFASDTGFGTRVVWIKYVINSVIRDVCLTRICDRLRRVHCSLEYVIDYVIDGCAPLIWIHMRSTTSSTDMHRSLEDVVDYANRQICDVCMNMWSTTLSTDMQCS